MDSTVDGQIGSVLGNAFDARYHDSNPVYYFVSNMAGGGMVHPGFSGGDRIAVESIKRWTDRREIHVFTGKAGYVMYRRYGVKGVHWHFTSSHTSFHDKMVHILLFSAQALFVGLLSAGFTKRPSRKSVVYCSDFLPEILPALLLKRRLNCRLVCGFYLFSPNPFRYKTYEGSNFARSLLLWLAQRISYQLVRRNADIVFVTNTIDRDKFVDHGKLTPSKVFAVEGGVDMKSLRSVPDTSDKRFDAVFIGRLHPQKGLMQLIEIWKNVCRVLPGARLAIIGTGPLEASVREKIRQYGLEKSVKMLGFLDGVEKIRIFKASKLVVHPAIYESGGMAAGEAMACGLPGICFDLEVLRTYYPRGMLRTKCFDIPEFAENILLLLRNDELYWKLSHQAAELALERDWDRKAQEILGVIEQ